MYGENLAWDIIIAWRKYYKDLPSCNLKSSFQKVMELDYFEVNKMSMPLPPLHRRISFLVFIFVQDKNDLISTKREIQTSSFTDNVLHSLESY
jgi:hypothetical protein